MASSLPDAVEHLWLENQAAKELLKVYQIPNWFDLVYEYCQREESKTHARERFAVARHVLRLAQNDSEALEALLLALQKQGKPN